jgi:GNAT superfamily N-acetyltransferase
MSASPVVIAPVRRDELAIVRRLAHEIWHQHYPGIIGIDQIEYMLERGYSFAALESFLDGSGSGLVFAMLDDEPVGFAAYQPGAGAGETKLDKLYVLERGRKHGVGRALVAHVEAVAHDAGCASLTLNVNRNNATAIRAYERMGFSIRESGDFPIGGGFVMEDYIMAKPLRVPMQ